MHPSSHPAIYILFISFPDYLNNLSPDSKEYEDTQGKPGDVSNRYTLLVSECHRMSVILFVCLCVSAAAALVVVSEISDQANDNLKHGVGLLGMCGTANVSIALRVFKQRPEVSLL